MISKDNLDLSTIAKVRAFIQSAYHQTECTSKELGSVIYRDLYERAPKDMFNGHAKLAFELMQTQISNVVADEVICVGDIALGEIPREQFVVALEHHRPELALAHLRYLYEIVGEGEVYEGFEFQQFKRYFTFRNTLRDIDGLTFMMTISDPVVHDSLNRFFQKDDDETDGDDDDETDEEDDDDDDDDDDEDEDDEEDDSDEDEDEDEGEEDGDGPSFINEEDSDYDHDDRPKKRFRTLK